MTTVIQEAQTQTRCRSVVSPYARRTCAAAIASSATAVHGDGMRGLPVRTDRAAARRRGAGALLPERVLRLPGVLGPAEPEPAPAAAARFRTWSATRRYERPRTSSTGPPRAHARRGLRFGGSPCALRQAGLGDRRHPAQRLRRRGGGQARCSCSPGHAARSAWQPVSFALVTFQHALSTSSTPSTLSEERARCWHPAACWSSRSRTGPAGRGGCSSEAVGPLWTYPVISSTSPPRAGAAGRVARSTGAARGNDLGASVAAYSLHYTLFGRLTPGWRLWLSYALGILVYPLVFLGDRVGGR